MIGRTTCPWCKRRVRVTNEYRMYGHPRPAAAGDCLGGGVAVERAEVEPTVATDDGSSRWQFSPGWTVALATAFSIASFVLGWALAARR